MKLTATITLLALLSSSQVQAQTTVPDGTKVRVRLEQNLSSKTADEGQTVELSVVDPVEIDGVTVIPEGSSAIGTVLTAKPSGRMGRAGKLDFSIDRIKAADGKWIPVRYAQQKRQGDSSTISTGIITAGVAFLFLPAAPLVLLRKGKDTNMHRGVTFEVYTDRNHTMVASSKPPLGSLVVSQQSDVSAQSVVETTFMPTGVTSPSPMATLSVSCAQQGAEIEVDGRFVGSTPSVLKVPSGARTIRVRYGSQIWERSLLLQSDSHVSLVPVFSATSVASMQ